MADKHQVPGEPALRWSSRAHTIDEVELELARIWSIPKLTATVAGVEERHVAARTSVMNLVVVARRPEIGEHARGDHPAAHRQAPLPDAHPHLGRPGEPVLARCPDPGLLRPATGRRVGDLRRADLHHRRRRCRAAPRGDRRAAAHPRPAGDAVVAGRAAVLDEAGRRAPGDGQPPGHRRVQLERRRPRAPARARRGHGALLALRERLRARPPEPLARGDRVRLRPARVHPVPHARSSASP